MQVCSGAVNVHRHDDEYVDGETIQSMAVNPNGTILAVVTQLRLQFWSVGTKTVYLTSLSIPDTTPDDNPALFVIWRPRQGNHLAVVTSRQVVFFEADINLKPGDFLQSVESRRHTVVLHHIDSASRVCYSCKIRIEAGLTTAAAAAGPYAFLVTTTAGVVYVVGWHRQDVLHQWTTVGLQDSGHVFTSAAVEKGDGCGGVTSFDSPVAVSSDATVLKLTNTSVRPSSADSLALPRGSLTSTTALFGPRVDPLQRHYQPLPSQSPLDPRPQSFSSEAVSLFGANAATIPATNAAAPPTSAKPVLLAPGGINPPGAAVRSGGENHSCSVSLSASPTLVVPPAAPSGRQTDTADTNSATTTDPLGPTDLPLGDSRLQKSDNFFIYGAGVTSTGAPRRLTGNRSGSGGGAGAGVAGVAAAVGNASAASRRGNGSEWIAGTILHTSFVSRWKVLAFVFSSGALLLCRPSCGTNFTHSKVQLQGCVTPLVSTAMVAINMRHLLIAVCTQAGALTCRRVDGATLAVSTTPLWRGLRGLQERGGACGASGSGSVQSPGLIAAMEWSPSDELLCVAFYKYGMVLLHYSGAVVTHHLAGPVNATLLRPLGAPGLCPAQQAGAAGLPSSSSSSGGVTALGCSFVFWKSDGTRLWMAAPDQPCFFSTQLSRVLAAETVGPTCGNHTPLTLLADNALYLVSVSEATERQGVRELVLLPEEYLRDQFPLLYGAVSYDGSWIACAGRHGALVFNRDRFSWKQASEKQEEIAFSCVADPVWLRSVALVVPALRTDTKAYELMVFSTSSVSPSHALARVALEGKPSMLSCVHNDHSSEGYVVVVDFNQVVRVFRYDAFMDAPNTLLNKAKSNNKSGDSRAAKLYFTFSPVQQLVLTGDLANPLQVTPVCLRGEEDDRENPQWANDQAELRLLLHRRSDHALVWLRGAPAAADATNNTPTTAPSNPLSSKGTGLPHLTAVSELLDNANTPAFVYHCWVDRTPPMRGALLLTHDEEAGIVLYHLQPQPSRALGSSSSESTSVEVRRIEVTPTRDTELLPLGVSPFDGYVLCCGTDTSVPRQTRRTALADSVNATPHPQLVLRPVLYAHRILSLLLLAAMPGGKAATTSSSALRAAQRSTAPKPATVGVASPNVLIRATLEDAPLATPQVSIAETDGRVASFMWNRSLFLWLECMRLNDTFVSVMDYFLHTALNEPPPAAVPGLGWRSAIRAVFTLLRNYPEFYTIVVGCVRKIDFTRWHLVLDFLGTPTALFRECVAHRCYAEAVHLVRVIMMGSCTPVATLSVERLTELSGNALASRAHSSNYSGGNGSGVGSLERASQCAIELFGLSIENGDYTAAYDLLRFMALLEDEIGMPAAGGFDVEEGGGDSAGASGGGASEGFLTRWLRQLTFSGAAYDDLEAPVDEAIEENFEALLNTRGDGSPAAVKSGATQQTKNQIGNYSTLVLDAARCEAGYGGRSAQDAAEEVQRQSAVRHMFGRHETLPAAVHHEALRLLLTGYVTQLAKLMDTFSLSITHFIRAACKMVTLSTASPAETDDRVTGNLSDNTQGDYTLHLHEVFDGLHKELGLPRSFYVPSAVAVSSAWDSWILEQHTTRAASLPGVLSATNPKVWTVAQSVLYATPQLRNSVEWLHRIFRGVFVYNLAFCVLLMRKSDLISLLLSSNSVAQSTSVAVTPSADSHPEDVSLDALITVLDHLEALLAVPENSGYKPFLQDVFRSLPPSVLRAQLPKRQATVARNNVFTAVLPE